MLRTLITAILSLLLGLAAAAMAPLSLPAPPGGTVRVLAPDPAHPGTVLLGTNRGVVFRSRDEGAHWSLYGRIGDHTDWVISSLVPDRGHPGHWFASLWSWAARAGGVFASSDDGQVWTPLWLGHAVRGLALAPSDNRILVAAALDGVFRSRDAGHTWSRISPAGNRELENIESVAIDPLNPEEIYVGTWHLPWKTVNGGHDWWQMRQGVIDDSDVFSIAVDRQHPSTIYLSACSGIYRSEDHGNQFVKIQGIPYSARRTPALVQDPDDPATIYAGTTQGLWVTHDRGADWRRLTSPGLEINTVAVLPHRILLGTQFAGIYSSANGGQSFALSNDGFSSRQVAARASSPAGVYVSVTGDEVWGGIFFHHDGAWRQLPALPERSEALGLHWSPQGVVAATGAGIYRLVSPSGGAPVWRRAAGPPTGAVYALTSPAPGSSQLWAAAQQGLFTSHDGGRHWQEMPDAPAPLYHLRAWTAPGGRTWLWVAGNGYVLRSDDGGRSFLPGRLALDAPGHTARIHQLATAVVPGGGVLLLAATSSGLYQSHDFGAHWTLSGHGLPALDIRSVHAQPGGALFAFGSVVGASYASRDGGQHWQAVALPVAVEATVRAAGVWPAAPTEPEVATSAAGGPR